MPISMTVLIRSVLCSLLIPGLGLEAVAAKDVHHDFSRPLPVNNQSPVVGVFGIPRAQGTDILGAGKSEWDVTLDLTSHFQDGESRDEFIFLDGETARFAVQGRYGIGDRWNLGVEIPWVHHGGGFLDGFIINWHDFWGFPQQGRDQAARDRVVYRYEHGGGTVLEVDAATGGPGDALVSAQRHLWRTRSGAGVFHAQVKLPTGDAGKLTGSGAADVSAGIELSRQWSPGWHSMFRAGAVYLGEGDVLPALQRHWAGYGGFDVVWRPLRALALRVQFDAHTAPYENTDLHELGQWSGLLTTGGTWHITDDTALDLSVVENVPNAAPVSDVTLQLRLRTSLGPAP